MNRAMLVRLLRSGAAGAVATGVDLATLTAMVSLAGMTPRTANVPALVLGAVVMFVGQKYFAFGSRGGALGRELALFAAVQVVGLALNAALFDLVLRFFPALSPYYIAVRLITSNLVWLGYSFPLWHFVFRTEPSPRKGTL